MKYLIAIECVHMATQSCRNDVYIVRQQASSSDARVHTLARQITIGGGRIEAASAPQIETQIGRMR